jgi:hypothetical protein
MAHGAARHGQPEPHIDEQPAGCLSGRLDRAMRAFCASAAGIGPGAPPKLSHTISDESFHQSGVLEHGASFHK